MQLKIFTKCFLILLNILIFILSEINPFHNKVPVTN